MTSLRLVSDLEAPPPIAAKADAGNRLNLFYRLNPIGQSSSG